MPLCTFAKSVTVIIIQKDAGATEIHELTTLLETEIMDAFFENGMIVSNEPAMTNAQDAQNVYSERLLSAKDGNMGYIVPITINYKNEGAAKDGLFLHAVIALDYELLDGATFAKKTFGTLYASNYAKGATERERKRAVKKIAQDMVSELSKSM